MRGLDFLMFIPHLIPFGNKKMTSKRRRSTKLQSKKIKSSSKMK
jgi:hypothetical protein